MTTPATYPGWTAIRKLGDGRVEITTWTREQGVTVCLVTGGDMTAALRRWHARAVGAPSNDKAKGERGPDAL